MIDKGWYNVHQDIKETFTFEYKKYRIRLEEGWFIIWNDKLKKVVEYEAKTGKLIIYPEEGKE